MKVLRTLGLVMLAAVAANAQSKSMLTGRIGSVEIQRGGGWVQLGAGEQINAGERVRTGESSSASLQLGAGKVITLSERTEIQVVQSNGSATIRLESGNMKVLATDDIQVSARDTTWQAAEKPLDLELGYQADKVNLMVISGAVTTGPVTIRGAQDSTKRRYVADSRHAGFSNVITDPNAFYNPNSFYIYYPYYSLGTPQQNPYSGITGQIVPPMTDPLRPAVQFPVTPFMITPPGVTRR